MSEVFFVAVYETNRAYGGAEEGGWWFDTGTVSERPEHLLKMRVFADNAKAIAYREQLDAEMMALNEEEGRRDPSSVACDGWWQAILTDTLPANFPDRKPHWE